MAGCGTENNISPDYMQEGGFPDLATKILEQLTHNAALENRFSDAAFYYYQLAVEALKVGRGQTINGFENTEGGKVQGVVSSEKNQRVGPEASRKQSQKVYPQSTYPRNVTLHASNH